MNFSAAGFKEQGSGEYYLSRLHSGLVVYMLATSAIQKQLKRGEESTLLPIFLLQN